MAIQTVDGMGVETGRPATPVVVENATLFGAASALPAAANSMAQAVSESATAEIVSLLAQMLNELRQIRLVLTDSEDDDLITGDDDN